MSTRITFVLPSFAGGGAERVMLQLLAGMDRSQFSPSLIAMHGDGPLAASLPNDVPLTDLARPRLRHALPALIGAIRRARPRAVVSSLGYVNIALLACRILLPLRTRIIVREANMPSLSLPGGPRPGLMRWLYRRYYPRADAVICTSHMMMGEMSGDIGVARTRLHLLPNPVDAPVLRAAIGTLTAGDENVTHFIAAGRLTRQKGFDRLIETFANLPGESRLTILGEGPERKALEAMRDNLGLSDKIHLPGFAQKPWPHYAAADAFLMPSRWEGMPNAALEALACGTPVIATPESGAIAEIAKAAPAGAVTVASWGEGFAAAMAEISIGGEEKPGPNLLPPGHEPAAVARRFENIIRQIC
ncbi:MAG: glycosyltransferase [Rhodospirillaceae bacterium]|nr:glycosyltransferase [Rhodospirillaceae bacterium]